MRNARPVCPNPKCQNHLAPPADFYWKKGYRWPKHNHQPVPRYQCKKCLTKFCGTQVKPIEGQHRPDLNKKIFALAVSGASVRRIALLTGCSRDTVLRKVEYLADEARKEHTKFMARLQANGGTAYVMMDELETYIHAKYKQVSVPMVVRVKTGEILGFRVARTSSKMPIGQAKGWTIDKRDYEIPHLLASIRPVLKSGATIATDSAGTYPKWIRTELPGVKHIKTLSPKVSGAYDPLFAINVVHAKMRNDLGRLGRKTWMTTKTIEALENHLWLWVAWTNRYRLK